MKASIGIAAELRARIASGVLAPGEPLPVEELLTVELGCSKPVVREALRILETEGLVEVRRGVGGGARVKHPTISDAAKSMGVYLQIGDVLVVDVWVARDRIVGSAIERVAGGGFALDELRRSVEVLRASVGDLAAFDGRLLDVGEAAVAAAGNRTEHVLVVALRHIVEGEIKIAAQRVVTDVAEELAIEAEDAVASAWEQVLHHLEQGDPAAARAAYEGQAGALRALVGAWIADLTVGDASAPS